MTARGIAAANAVLALLAVVALAISLVALHGEIKSQERDRQTAKFDSCSLIVTVVTVATPPDKQQQLKDFLNHSPLSNCRKYSREGM